MGVQLTNVQCTGDSSGSRPRIVFWGDWLAESGFVTGALVQVLPESGGIVFRLCDEDIIKYSDLYLITKESGGSLVQACSDSLRVSGHEIFGLAGFDYGDSLIARYEYGLIRVRKLPRKSTFIPAIFGQDEIRIYGDWLCRNGFIKDSVITVKPEPDAVAVTVKLVEYSDDLVKDARRNKTKLLQVERFKKKQRVRLPASVFENAGFGQDEDFLAVYDHGIIKFQRFDWERLGF